MRVSELERELAPLREEYRGIVNPWLVDGLFHVTYPALLVETYHYVKHSCSLMSHACARLAPEEVTLQRYLAHHIAEEVSHEQWVLDDLETLGYNRGEVGESLPLPETISMIGSQLYVINYLDPKALIGYVYVMESMPPGKNLFEYLEAAGIPRKAMSFLVNHGDADIVHRQELEAYADRVIAGYERFADNLPSAIEHRQVIGPYDMEQEYGLVGGNIMHGDLTLDQLFSWRPVAGYADYRTPIKNLYLCGSGTHPGGGISGINGRNASREILKDLKRRR